jgi:hypothetical protein
MQMWARRPTGGTDGADPITLLDALPDLGRRCCLAAYVVWWSLPCWIVITLPYPFCQPANSTTPSPTERTGVPIGAE